MYTPFVRQLFVASAPQLAAISSGAVISFPNILFQQLNRNDSTIHLDIHTMSWIGSVHGLVGIFACFVPLIMQYKGRKLTFIMSCLVGIIGWITVYFSRSAVALIIAEVFKGVSGSSVLTSSLISMSEMLNPRYRITMMNAFIFGQVLGTCLVILVGHYFHWKTVSLIACCPIIVALLIGLAWPESPAWLAYKGDYDQCEETFKWLRGSDADSLKELNQMICSQKEKTKVKQVSSFQLNKNLFSSIRRRIFQRDFYLPCLHIFVLLYSIYWSGLSAVLIYSVNILQQVTGSDSASSISVIIMYSIQLFGSALGLVFSKHFKNKTIILSGITGAIIFMLSACIASYLQDIKVLSGYSHLSMYCLICYIISFNLGASITIPSLAAELIPVKNRGIGGALYVMIVSVLDFSSLKATPYMFVSLKLWATFLIFAINALVCIFFIWKYIPETKNRTLRDIEEFYNKGECIKASTDDGEGVLEHIMHVDN